MGIAKIAQRGDDCILRYSPIRQIRDTSRDLKNLLLRVDMPDAAREYFRSDHTPVEKTAPGIRHAEICDQYRHPAEGDSAECQPIDNRNLRGHLPTVGVASRIRTYDLKIELFGQFAGDHARRSGVEDELPLHTIQASIDCELTHVRDQGHARDILFPLDVDRPLQCRCRFRRHLRVRLYRDRNRRKRDEYCGEMRLHGSVSSSAIGLGTIWQMRLNRALAKSSVVRSFERTDQDMPFSFRPKSCHSARDSILDAPRRKRLPRISALASFQLVVG